MSKNGKDSDNKKVVKFPSLADRDRMKREERAEDERWRKEYKAKQRAAANAQNPPFFNFGRIPPFTKWMVISLIAVHAILYLAVDSGMKLKVFYTFGFIPSVFTGNSDFGFTALALATPLTHMMIHGGWMHLFFNVVMGLALGIFFEKAYGTAATTKFFIICGIGGALAYLALNPFTTTPVIGASGATSGLFGAAIIMMIRQNPHNPLAQKFGKKGPWPIIIFWGLFMVVMGLMGGGDMAWQAHVGGYASGVILFTLIQKGKIRL